jgi:Uma2 family endonuclease
MRTLKKLFTAEELLCLPTVGRRLELVQGKVYEMAPAGGRHGHIAGTALILVGSHVRKNQLGRVFTAETGFILRRDPDTVRAPDVSFVPQDRMKEEDIPDGYIDVVPDLVVEVVSPSDRRREVREKVEEWLRAGVRLAWVIYPVTRSADVYRSPDDISHLSEDDVLDGEDVVPGFACRLGELFG